MKVVQPLSRLPPTRLAFAALLLLHAALLAFSAARQAPVWDEPSHLVAGISHWQLGTFDLGRVNPPLVRTIATVPVLIAGLRMDWSRYNDNVGCRSEHAIRADFVADNRESLFRFHRLARWACIPFSLIGGSICLRWASELYGRRAGIVALSLWCFSPNIIAHGQLAMADAGATAFGVASAYVFWRWLRLPSWEWAATAGLLLGLTQLTKTTWILLFGLWPLLWLVWRCTERADAPRQAWFREGCQIGLILLIGLLVINLGYGFEGSFRKLGDYRFVSYTLSGERVPSDAAIQGANRFAGTWLSEVPVPLPQNYVAGIDSQKWDFERRWPSYLRGEWREGGWWYYYLYALAIKLPLGTWALVLLAIAARLCRRDDAGNWRNELVLLTPIAAVLTLVSSQTGFSHHLRYVLPILPFVFVWASKIADAVVHKNRRLASVAAIAFSGSVASSLWCYPHSLSYFNEAVGGPRHGHLHLLDSNIDWGQDLLYLKQWFDEHREARPLGVAYHLSHVDPSVAGIEHMLPPRHVPEPGWYALSIGAIYSRTREYEYFLDLEPVAMSGYSIYIYHLTLDQAIRIRRKLGAPANGD